MKKKRIISLLLAVALICTCFYGCSKKEEPSVTEEGTTAGDVTSQQTTDPLEIEQTIPATPEKDAAGNYINNLTGLYDVSEEAAGKRPMAVMRSNIKAALPQYGISDADII